MQDPQAHKRSYSARAMNCDQGYHLPSIHGKTLQLHKDEAVDNSKRYWCRRTFIEKPFLTNSNKTNFK